MEVDLHFGLAWKLHSKPLKLSVRRHFVSSRPLSSIVLYVEPSRAVGSLEVGNRVAGPHMSTFCDGPVKKLTLEITAIAMIIITISRTNYL